MGCKKIYIKKMVINWKFWKKKVIEKKMVIYHVEEILPDNSGTHFVFTNQKEFHRHISEKFDRGDIFFLPNGDQYVLAGNVTYQYRANEKKDITYTG